MENKRLKSLRDCDLIGCLNESGITSENFREFLYQPERLNPEAQCEHEWEEEEFRGLNKSKFFCKKCHIEMR